MKLNDVNGTAINTDKIPLINPSAIDLNNNKLILNIGSVRYGFDYLKAEDLQADYKKLYALIESK